MSMNLHCKQLELWQTPTHITYMCVMQDDGKISSNLKGKKARRALYMYRQWVRSCINGVWDDEEERKSHEEFLNNHVKRINDVIK